MAGARSVEMILDRRDPTEIELVKSAARDAGGDRQGQAQNDGLGDT